jgi:hypothetical protein
VSLKSSLKAHCKPGPRSPTRCTSSAQAAIPPTFLPYDTAVAFYKTLKSSELANPTMRQGLGEMATSLYAKDKKSLARSVAQLQNLCSLSKNESATTALRALSKSLCRDESSNAANAAIPGSNAAAATAEDAVRFSAAVQSQLYDVNAAPNEVPAAQRGSGRARLSGGGTSESGSSVSAGAGVHAKAVPGTSGRRSGDFCSKRRGPRSGSQADKSQVSRDRRPERSKQRRAQRVSDRPGNVPSRGVEKSGSKNSHKAAV